MHDHAGLYCTWPLPAGRTAGARRPPPALYRSAGRRRCRHRWVRARRRRALLPQFPGTEFVGGIGRPGLVRRGGAPPHHAMTPGLEEDRERPTYMTRWHSSRRGRPYAATLSHEPAERLAFGPSQDSDHCKQKRSAISWLITLTHSASTAIAASASPAAAQ